MKGDCFLCMAEKDDVQKCLICQKMVCMNHFMPNVNMCTKCSERFEDVKPPEHLYDD